VEEVDSHLATLPAALTLGRSPSFLRSLSPDRMTTVRSTGLAPPFGKGYID